METDELNQTEEPGAEQGETTHAEKAPEWTPWRDLRRNLHCGVRIALLRRVAIDDLRAAPGDLALLAVADLLLNLLLSFSLVGLGGEFAFRTLPSFFFHLPLLLFAGLLAGRLCARPALTTALPVALIALSIPLELCHAVLEGGAQLPRLGWLAGYLDAPYYYRFFWWWTAAAALFVGRLAPAPKPRRAAALLVFLAFVVAPLSFFPRGDLWVGSEGAEGGELHLTDEVLAAQGGLLDEQLAGLLPGRKGEEDLYFVGFAGDASQDVFTKELTAVARLAAERFGAAGRTVTLANNPRTATELPFATAANLERALERVGTVMNRDEDVLFLFLTSHGSPEQVLAVDNPPLELDELTPEAVRRMLKRSGITWRVIVVSACYAGGFIDPLKDDHTLIVTAADASHESFGCQNGEGFTWFGRAYFDEALRHTRSFTAAFAEARKTIRKWEEEKGETPSNPQIWVGKEMERKLARLESRRKAEGKR